MNDIKIIILITLLSFVSCGDENDKDCLTLEEIANSSCPAEDIPLVCDPYFCGASFPPDEEHEGIVVDFLLPPPETECEVIDCTTLDCGEIFSELQIGQFGLPSGLITISDGRESNFSCSGIFD